jgi:hypothetical protein
MIHTYGGLLFFPVLIIVGISAYDVNHPLSFLKPHEKWTISEKTIYIPEIKQNNKLAESVRDSLGLMGWLPDWKMNRNNERFIFEISHNGAEYRINAELKTGRVEIKRRAKGFGSTLRSLHPFNENLPSGTFLVNSWQYYKDASVFYVILAIASGLWFFLKRKTGRTAGIIVIVSALLLTLLLTYYTWQTG